MQSVTNIMVHDILEMKKPHPCGSKTWEVLRIGVDFRLRCTGCHHEMMITRIRALKSARKIIRNGNVINL